MTEVEETMVGIRGRLGYVRLVTAKLINIMDY